MRRDSCRLKHIVRSSNVLALHPSFPPLNTRFARAGTAILVAWHFSPNCSVKLGDCDWQQEE